MVIAQLLFRVFCHQSSLRSPELGGVAFPLCWRCAGMHLGLVSAYFYLWVSGGFPRRFPEIRYVAVLALLPFGLDGFGNAFRFWSSPPGVRAATGLVAGVVLPLILVPLRRPLEPSRFDPPTISHVSSLLWPIALGGGGLVLLTFPASPLTFQVLALAVTLGALLFLIHVCQALFSVAVVSHVSKKERCTP
jgi:uncharacterized membrane protein